MRSRNSMVLVFDGALGTELAKLTPLDAKLWSGSVIESQPELIQQVHESYILGGAEFITTATYQVSYHGLKDAGMGDKCHEIWGKALQIAQRATEVVDRKVKVLGSIGPYGAYVNDGSEYHGNYSASLDDLIKFHQPMVEFWNQSDVDIIIFETIPNVVELQAILGLEIKKPWIISFRINEVMTIDVMKKIDLSLPNLMALGINCVDYRDVTKYLRQLLTSPANLLVYPNYGYKLVNGEYKFEINKQQWTQEVHDWIELGVWGIGGCCSTSPDEISIIHDSITNRLSEVTSSCPTSSDI